MTTPANATPSAAAYHDTALATFNIYQIKKTEAVKDGENSLSCLSTLASAAKQCVHVLLLFNLI